MINLKIPENVILKPTITVFGVGGGGCNAVNNMIASQLNGVTFVVANTDAQAIEHSLSDRKIQLGANTTRGLGAGADREIGAAAAEESKEEIISRLEGSNMVFITAGMGGGTGTGAAPVVAKLAKEMGILTVAVVTKPFHFEGAHRMKTADAGISELQKFVDTLIIIPNQNLFRIANERTTFTEAFQTADEVLKKGVQSITDLMIMPGLINLDFADINAVMSKMGKAMMGTGEATGDDRAVRAAETAIQNPLLDQSSMKGARGVLINITGGGDMTLFEVDAAANRIREEVDNQDANIIFGSTFDPKLDGIIRVSVVATGIDSEYPIHNVTTNSAIKSNTRLGSMGTVSHSVAEMILSSKKDTPLQDVPSTTILETQIASFDEYDLPSQPQQEPQQHTMYTPAQDHMIEKQMHYDTAPKPSLFSRMWESFKGADDVGTGHSQHHAQHTTKSSKHNDNAMESDVYEIPAFLRRNNQK